VSPDSNASDTKQMIVIPAGYAIRPARPNDAGNIAQIFLQAPEAACWSERATWEVLESPRIFAFVVQSNNSSATSSQPIVAFAAGRVIAGEAEVLNLAVLKTLRQIGLGRALVAMLLGEFQKESVTRVFLEVRESNHAAAELYRKMGFNVLGRRSGYYQNPLEAALILEKLLGEMATNSQG
jgi:[ribosomal protein S18]-alanine N-acetyltransferase